LGEAHQQPPHTAINTPGVIPAGLPGNSPVFQWTNATGTVAYETMSLGPRIRGFSGGVVLVLLNGTMIPYGTNDNVPGGMPFNFTTPQQVLWYINSSFVPLPAGSSPPS